MTPTSTNPTLAPSTTVPKHANTVNNTTVNHNRRRCFQVVLIVLFVVNLHLISRMDTTTALDSPTLPYSTTAAAGTNKNATPLVKPHPLIVNIHDFNDGDDDHDEKIIYFEPGTLNISRAQAFARCHLPRETYGKNYQPAENKAWRGYQAIVSDQHQLQYYLIPKSASSSNRWILSHDFNATDGAWPTQPHEYYHHFTFTRDPLGRFYSAFQEAIAMRQPPWERGIVSAEERAKLPLAYIYEGMNSNKDLRDRSICSEDCFRARFDRFVQEYNQLRPPDPHFTLQAPSLYYFNRLENKTLDGPLIHFVDDMYDIKELKQVYSDLAQKKGVQLASTRAQRKGHVLFDYSKTSVETNQRICRMMATDYCCLNYVLPQVCQGVGIRCKLLPIPLDGKHKKIVPATMPTIGGIELSEEEALKLASFRITSYDTQRLP